MKKLFICILSAVFFLAGFFYPLKASCETLSCEYIEIAHLDTNYNGIVDQEDLFNIENALISNDVSTYCVIDLITAYQIFYDQFISEVPVINKIYYLAEDPDSQCRTVISNYVTSDYPKQVYLSDNTVTISFLMWEGKKEFIFNRSFTPYNEEQILVSLHASSYTVVILTNLTAEIIYN